MTTALHRDLIPFLKDLGRNNNRDWFNKHKDRFDEVQGSVLEFLTELAPRLARVSRHIAVVPKKSGGSLMRIYRDTRFGKDKSPYNTHVSAQLRHVRGKDIHAPGFYLRVEPGGVTLGAGIWQPEGAAITKIRKAIDRHPARWKKARDDRKFKQLYGELRGESLKRPPRGFDAEHPCIDDLKRKDFVAFRELNAGACTRKDFLDKVVDTYAASSPLMKFLCDALGLKY